jgi:hypothetical protein
VGLVSSHPAAACTALPKHASKPKREPHNLTRFPASAGNDINLRTFSGTGAPKPVVVVTEKGSTSIHQVIRYRVISELFHGAYVKERPLLGEVGREACVA